LLLPLLRTRGTPARRPALPRPPAAVGSRAGRFDLEITPGRRHRAATLVDGHAQDVGEERLHQPADFGMALDRHGQRAIARADGELAVVLLRLRKPPQRPQDRDGLLDTAP